MDSQEEQQWDNNNAVSGGKSVLASDSDNSVIFVVEKPLPSVQHPTLLPELPPMPCLPFQVQPVTLLHPLVNNDQVFYSIIINIFHLNHFSLVHMDKKLIILYILLIFIFLFFFW